MKKFLSSILGLASLTLCTIVFASPSPCLKKGLDTSCAQICSACQKAGFIEDDSQRGLGLWTDCVGPLVLGKHRPDKSARKTHILPTPPKGGWEPVGERCRKKNPGWGSETAMVEKKQQ